MKKLFYITGVIVLSCVIASSVIAAVTTEPYKETATEFSESLEQDTYLLTCENDRIIAYKAGSDKPFIETTTSVSSLPYDVQQRLRSGIEYQSLEALQSALSEYCS